MKKLINGLLCAALTLGMTACSSDAKQSDDAAKNDSPVEEQTETNEEETNVSTEETVDDPSWDALESLGMVETENGLFYVSVTLPADLVGENITQESIDSNAGETYTSGKLNDDGSVTYKMTKKQHRAMLDSMTESFDESLDEMAESEDNAISSVSHSADFTEFDVYLTTDELGLQESFMVIVFYMYGGVYSLFSGRQSDIIVNYYSSSGNLLHTASSADMSD